MSSQPKYHHGDLKQALIEAGLELLKESGAAALTLRKVAKRAGVSHAAPYRHFSDKTALFAAIAIEGFHILEAALREAGTTNPVENHAALVETGLAYVRFATAYPAHMSLMFSGMMQAERQTDALRLAALASLAQVVDVVERSQEVGSVRQGDTFQLAVTAWSMAHGLAMLAMEGVLGNLEMGGSQGFVEAALRNLVVGLDSPLASGSA